MDWEERFRIWALESNVSNSETETELNLSQSRLLDILDGTEKYQKLDGRHILVITLGVIAIAINTTTLAAIKHIRRRLTANQIIMFSLCCSDLLTAAALLGKLTNQQLFHMDSVKSDQRVAAICVYKIIQALVMTGHISTLCNLLCLAVDHYCAIAKPLTYSVYMSKSRVRVILAATWILSVIFGFSDFLIPARLHGYCEGEASQNYCERVLCSEYEPDHLMFCVVIVCMEVMTVMYGCIMWILYRYQQQDYATATQRKAQRHVRGLITSFIILGLFAILWLPNCIMDAYTTVVLYKARANPEMQKSKFQNFQIYQHVFSYLYALVILNAICDPIVYAMRMRDIQESLKLLLCFKRPTFSNKIRGFGENRKQSSNSSLPLKYVQRQFSNSTNTTMCSGGTLPASASTNSTIQERKVSSRNGTLISQTSEEELPLHRQSILTQNDTDLDDRL